MRLICSEIREICLTYFNTYFRFQIIISTEKIFVNSKIKKNQLDAKANLFNCLL